MLQSEDTRKIPGKNSKGSGTGLTTSRPHISSHTRTTFSSTPQYNPVKQSSNTSRSVNNTVSLRRGDTLWEIAQKKLGDGSRWRELRKADGSRFKPQEVRHLPVGTRVSVPWTKPTTKTNHSATSMSATPYLSTTGITHRDFTPVSTSLTRNTQSSASPAFFSKTSQVSSQLLSTSTKDKSPGRYFDVLNYQSRENQSGDSPNSWGNAAVHVVAGTVKGQVASKLFPNQPSVKISRHPKEPGAKSAGSAGRNKFRSDIAEIIGTAIENNKSHPLQDLVYKDKKNKWKLKTEYEAGHLTSNHSGRREMFAVEAQRFNQGDNRLEAKEKGYKVLKKLAVDIDGVPVERRTAKMLEKQGLLPKGTVKKASSHPGWTRGVQVKDEAIERIAARLDLSNPDNQKRIQALKNIAEKPQLLQGRRSKEVGQLYEFYTRSLRDITSDRKSTSKPRLTRQRIGGEPLNIRTSRIIREIQDKRTYHSSPRTIKAIRAVKNSRAATRVIRGANTVKNLVVQPVRFRAREATNTGKNFRPATAVARRTNIFRNPPAANTTLGLTRKVTQSGVTKGVLRGVSRVAAPVGIALDTWQLGSAYKKDGFGKEFRKTAGSVAGAWGGAAAGAAIGSAIFPGVGTVVGGAIGGIAGSAWGDDIEQRAEKAGKAIAGGAKKAWNKLFG
ncbi:glycine zipper domain-containing protein [uncultured Nostoc sp.]|uniref:glycine zipper domain-containing protein n=1 Tax=uncultured Nostoc sp. TaxID=340711 RepID=UPI0035CA2AD4